MGDAPRRTHALSRKSLYILYHWRQAHRLLPSSATGSDTLPPDCSRTLRSLVFHHGIQTYQSCERAAAAIKPFQCNGTDAAHKSAHGQACCGLLGFHCFGYAQRALPIARCPNYHASIHPSRHTSHTSTMALKNPECDASEGARAQATVTLAKKSGKHILLVALFVSKPLHSQLARGCPSRMQSLGILLGCPKLSESIRRTLPRSDVNLTDCPPFHIVRCDLWGEGTEGKARSSVYNMVNDCMALYL